MLKASDAVADQKSSIFTEIPNCFEPLSIFLYIPLVKAKSNIPSCRTRYETSHIKKPINKLGESKILAFTLTHNLGGFFSAAIAAIAGRRTSGNAQRNGMRDERNTLMCCSVITCCLPMCDVSSRTTKWFD